MSSEETIPGTLVKAVKAAGAAQARMHTQTGGHVSDQFTADVNLLLKTLLDACEIAMRIELANASIATNVAEHEASS